MDRIMFSEDKPDNPEDGIYWIMRERATSEPVGFSGMRLLPSEAGVALRTRSGVSRACRGKGLQRRLIRVSQDYCRNNGIHTLLATTMCWNAASINNFIRCGFKTYDPQWRWMDEGNIYWKWHPYGPVRTAA
jgi:GNAT superfamily N-acetyltransferase